MELRQLEAFVAVATELHFGRAAQKMQMGQPTLSDLVRRLEREIGASLLTRTTRRVALTSAGAELLDRATVILGEVAAATAAVQRLAAGDAGTVRLGITPPVASVLAPHLTTTMRDEAPGVDVVVSRMWLTDLRRAVAEGTVDVAITCGRVPEPAAVAGEVFCGEPLLVSVRPAHPFAALDSIPLDALADHALGLHSEALFPAWTLAARQALADVELSPPVVELTDTDLSACHWPAQPDVEWILTTASICGVEMATPVRPAWPPRIVPYTLLWNPHRASTPAIGRFVHMALSVDVPAGWVTQPGHLRHDPPG